MAIIPNPQAGSTSNSNTSQQAQDAANKQREALNDAYAAVVGQQSVQSFSAFTFEDAMELQIEKISGAGTKLRPNLLDKVAAIKNALVQAVQQLKGTKPETFRDRDNSNDVNTNPDGSTSPGIGGIGSVPTSVGAPSIPSIPGTPAIPSVPQVPGAQQISALTNSVDPTKLTTALNDSIAEVGSKIPQVPQLPALPSVPPVPSPDFQSPV